MYVRTLHIPTALSSNVKSNSLSIVAEDARGGDDEELSSRNSEDEGGTAALATKRLGQEIAVTIGAIRKENPKMYDGKTTCFPPFDEEGAETGETEVKRKPVFLEDYHSQNLFAEVTSEEKEEGAPATFVRSKRTSNALSLVKFTKPPNDPRATATTVVGFLFGNQHQMNLKALTTLPTQKLLTQIPRGIPLPLL